MLSAFLIIHTIAYAGITQSVTAFRYGSMRECFEKLQLTQLKFTDKGALAVPMYCSDKQPAWWVTQ